MAHESLRTTGLDCE